MRSIDILEQIGELSAEAEWSDEELDAALLEQGVDPNRFVRMVMSEIEPLLNDGREVSGGIELGVGGSLPLIEVLRQKSKLSISAIANALDVSSGFLTEIARHPTAIPEKWREELISRATYSLNIESTLMNKALTVAVPERGVALSQNSRRSDVITYRGILDRSGMTAKQKQFWLNLASQRSTDSV